MGGANWFLFELHETARRLSHEIENLKLLLQGEEDGDTAFYRLALSNSEKQLAEVEQQINELGRP